jgi:hypothetical protein
VKVAGRRLGVGGASRPAGVIGPANQGVRVGVSKTGSTGNAARLKRQQLACRRRARVSAQLAVLEIFTNGSATGRGVTSLLWSSMNILANVFVAWPAG